MANDFQRRDALRNLELALQSDLNKENASELYAKWAATYEEVSHMDKEGFD